jgi:ABC-type Fe3+/spermidine/putrescine transport system ATPase subunit
VIRKEKSRFTHHGSRFQYPMSLLELRHIHKSYPDGWALTDVNFCVEQGEIVCLLGPSGCGKTTLLRVIAGLEPLDGGQVLVNGEDVTHSPPHLRGFGLMFQEYALFPHKDVRGNVAFGLRMLPRTGSRSLARVAVAERVADALALVGLAGFEHRDVNQLSGGERQRVALARSLAPRPRLLMLDEPLGALDRNLRERLLDELPDILHRAGATAITVTHDQEEAFAIADRVVLLKNGHVVQIGAPQKVYRQPVSAWVARFLGLTNLLDAKIVEGEVETAIGRLEIGDWRSAAPNLESPISNLQLLIRPEAAQLGDGPNTMRGVVTERSFRGERYRLGVRHESGIELAFNVPANADLPACGEPIILSLDPQALTILPAESTN